MPIGLFATIWGYLQLRELGQRRSAHIDWWGNATFALGLVSIMVGITYGIEPYGGHAMGWTSPRVIVSLTLGVVLLVVFCIIEVRVREPMFTLGLFKIRAFTAGIFASFLAAISRGGLMFMLIIWLQGIWLPLHGYSFSSTPLWAGIALIPLTVGMFIAGPISGVLSDRYGPRPFATGGMIGAAICFALLEALPINFSYPVLRRHPLLHRLHHGVVRCAQPHRGHELAAARAPRRRVGHEHHVPELGPGDLHRHLLLADDPRPGRPRCPTTSPPGLLAHGVPAPVADQASHLPPISTLFAAFLGYNPVQHLVGAQTIAHLSATQQAALAQRGFFPGLIAESLHQGSPRRLRLRHRDEPGRGRRLVDPGQALRPHAGRRRARGRAGADPDRRPRGVNGADRAVGGPLRVASLAKQIPLAESMRLEDGRLVRDGLDLEMNAYCRRAVAHGVTLARETGGTCTALTLGPPSAEDVLREAVAWGADGGLHVCDEAFAGSDTLATARALAAALEGSGPYDLVLVGRNSLDGETGQVGPELAELLGLPFAGGVKRLEDRGGWLRLELELDDGTSEVEVQLPAVLSVAERLCEPCKVHPEGRAAVPAERITRVGPAELGAGPWGEPGSPTVVGPTHPMEHNRTRRVLDGPVDEQVQTAVRTLAERGALTDSSAPPDARRASPPPRAPPAIGCWPSCSSRAAPRWAPSSSGRRCGWPRSSAARSRRWRRAPPPLRRTERSRGRRRSARWSAPSCRATWPGP